MPPTPDADVYSDVPYRVKVNGSTRGAFDNLEDALEFAGAKLTATNKVELSLQLVTLI